MYPDLRFCSVAGQAAPAAVNDDAWYKNEYIPTVGKRGAAIIAARGASSAASAANAAIDHMRASKSEDPKNVTDSFAVGRFHDELLFTGGEPNSNDKNAVILESPL